MSIVECAKYVHCNERLPEQNNACITNLRSNDGYIYKDGKFVVIKREELLNRIISHRMEDIRGIIEEGDIYIKKEHIEKIKDLLDKIDNEDKEQIDQIKQEIIHLLYNNREMALKRK
jgi:hypothetical protein